MDRLDRLGCQQRLQRLHCPECQGNCTNRVWTPASHDTWTGCFTDRTQNYDTTNTAPSNGNTPTLFPAEQYSYCDSSGAKIATIMPLSYDWTALKAKIDTMVPTGNTNQGIGLAWGWMTLTQSDPFNAPAKDPNYVYKDALVILSDGLNTQNRWYFERRARSTRARGSCATTPRPPTSRSTPCR